MTLSQLRFNVYLLLFIQVVFYCLLMLAPKCLASTLVNKLGATPLHIACCMKAFHSIKLLLEMRCSANIPNMKGETAYNILLNEDGDCLLHIACQWGVVGIVRYLITDEKCDLNVQSSKSKNTPLHIVAMHEHVDVLVRLLSCKKCNLNIQNSDGNTPLHIAVRKNKTTVIL